MIAWITPKIKPSGIESSANAKNEGDRGITVLPSDVQTWHVERARECIKNLENLPAKLFSPLFRDFES